jgi:hypothetical protein
MTHGVIEMPNNAVPAAATGLPLEPAFTVTDAGRLYLLMEDIQANGADLPPAIAAELAALTSRKQSHV